MTALDEKIANDARILNIFNPPFPSEPPKAVNAFSDGTSQESIGSGLSTGKLTMVDGYWKSSNYVTGVSGWIITPTGDVEFASGVFRGALSASTIDIGTGATSFHVDINGNVWSGAATYATAPFTVSNLGAVTASNMTITGGNISGSILSGLHIGSMPSIQGWTSTITFSASDYRTIAWTSGAITLTDGTVYTISSGNTGNLSALTYIYIDIGVSSTVLQVTTTAANSVGTNRILLAVCQNNSDTTSKSTVQVFGGAGGQLLKVDNIVANSASTNEFISNTAQIKDATISSAKISDLAVTKLTAGTLGVAANVGNGNVVIDGVNKRLLVNDGTNDRILIGHLAGKF